MLLNLHKRDSSCTSVGSNPGDCHRILITSAVVGYCILCVYGGYNSPLQPCFYSNRRVI